MLGLLLVGCVDAAPLFLAEPLVGDLLSPDLGCGGGVGTMMSRGIGGGNHGCMRPVASPLQVLTSRAVSL